MNANKLSKIKSVKDLTKIKTRSQSPDMPVDETQMSALTAWLQEELKEIRDTVTSNNAMLRTIQGQIDVINGEVKTIKDDVAELQHSAQDSSDRMDKVSNTFLPAISSQITKVASALAERMLDMEIHGRKWSLIINGLDGVAGEDDVTTRVKCVSLAKDLGVSDAATTTFAACHRLDHSKANAGIIVRFTDLAQREAWLKNAGKLRRVNEDVSFSPDLPPVLRKMKTELLNIRKSMPASEKQITRVKHIARWPYVKLTYKNDSKPAIVPTCTKQQILTDILGFSAKLAFDSL